MKNVNRREIFNIGEIIIEELDVEILVINFDDFDEEDFYFKVMYCD